MYFFYVDESGTLDPEIEQVRPDGSKTPKEHLYVVTALSLFEHQWHGFEKTLNRKKRDPIDLISRRQGIRLELADCELKSTWIRIPKQRAKRMFLSALDPDELTALCDTFYQQLEYHRMHVFCVVVDKRRLPAYMDRAKLHRKAWELLLERIEEFMRVQHGKHQALMICDDLSIQDNRALAMKHAYLLEEGTTQGAWLKHICEMPHFVRSELCNGIQLADLVGYNLYRAFRDEGVGYPFLERVLPRLWSSPKTAVDLVDGLYVFPGASPLVEMRRILGKERARIVADPGCE